MTTAALVGRGPASRLRVIHLLTGDGVPTNMAAARRLLHSYRKDAHVEYRLIVWLCAAHQANLVVQVAICGSLLADPVNQNGLCGTCSRLFKYLISDYFDEFSSSLRSWVTESLRLVQAHQEEVERHRHQVEGLRALYGEEVLPDSLLRFYNVTLQRPDHKVCGQADLRELRGQLFSELQRRILRVEEHPIVTRFWLFGTCVRTLLLMNVFNVPPEVFAVQSMQPQVKQQKRLDAVRAYWGRPETPAELRQACLCLRLTSFCLNKVSVKRDGPGAVLMALSKGDVQERSGALCCELIRSIHMDPALPAVPALVALLATLGHLIGRFAQYQEYPTRLWRLSRHLNQARHLMTSSQQQPDIAHASLCITILFTARFSQLHNLDLVSRVVGPTLASHSCRCLQGTSTLGTLCHCNARPSLQGAKLGQSPS